MPFRNEFRQLKVSVLCFFGLILEQKVGAKIDDGDVPLISSTNMAVPSTFEGIGVISSSIPFK